ncbi:hypothetical protein EJ04DRAFT_559932 [Polyplosphaeria fusca]|uniref:Uncharacterized protein n=1 Tax=Polyplosphaeria fusca TaxID=682080 RepID=A0A9P4V5T8_9PLEO|nr:hypothetical protein EJ04DRAFT_559932 [Polyplosphaeria fusca]
MKEKRRHDPGPKTGSLAGGRTNKSHMVVDPEARHDRPEWITDGAKLKQPSLSLFGVKAASLNETHSLDDMRQWLPHSSTSEHYSAPFQSPFSRQQSPKPVKPSSSFTQPPSIPRRTTSTSGLPPSNFPRRTITRSRSLPLSNALPVRAPAARPSPKNTRPPPLSIPGPYPLLPSSFSKIKADALGSAPNLLPLSKQVITEERPSEDLGHRQNAVFVAGRACPKGAHEPKDLGVTKRTHVKANRQKAGGLTKKESVLRRSVRALTCGFLSMPMGNSKGKSKMKEALKSNGDGGAMEKPARYWPRLEITKRNSR